MSISIHAAREGGDPRLRIQRPKTLISIHAAREGGDFNGGMLGIGSSISIHAAREGGDVVSIFASKIYYRFQSTPPVKAATLYKRNKKQNERFQSTPPVKAATLV